MTAKELRVSRAAIVNQARDLANKDGATAEDLANVDRMLAEVDTMQAQITRLERTESLSAELAKEIGRSVAAGRLATPVAADATRVRNIASAILARRVLTDEDKQIVADVKARDMRIMAALSVPAGEYGLSADDREHLNSAYVQPQNAGSTTTTAGGYTIAPLFQAELLVALKAFGGMREVSRSISTDTGADLPWPAMDDTANSATIVGENPTLTADTDLAFTQKVIKSFTYASGPLPVSLQLLQDSAFDFGSVIEAAMVARFGRKQNSDFTVGAGTTLPFGVITGSTLGATGAAGQVTAVIYDDFVNLIHSVDPAYRPGARFMFHDSTLKAVKLLKDSQNRPLFVPSIAAGVPDTIADTPYTINQSMPVMAASAKSILYGNFANYIIRDVLGMQMMVLRERFADNLQVAWLAFMRTDGKLISGGSAIKWYANPAS